jgi:hypothetical protein
MFQSFFGARLSRAIGVLTSGGRDRVRRATIRRSPVVESLEGRALLSGLSVSAVLTSTAVGSGSSNTIALTNSSTSSQPVGTFWYAWTPNPQDFLASMPSSVTAPSGWTAQITPPAVPGHDGFAIEFTANAGNALQPGHTLDFQFQSPDSPAAINGNSVFYPSTPVGTSFAYTGAPFVTPSVEFVVTPASSTPPPTSGVPVTVTAGQTNLKKRMVTQITIDFSGSVNGTEAANTAIYRLAIAGKHNSFTKGAAIVKLRSAVYNSATNSVTLTPRKAFALTKPVQLVITGTPPSGLQDTSGQFIDGANNGQAGSNAVIMITKSGVIV